MVKQGFRQVLASRKLLTGTIVTLEAPAVAERLVDAGFDWLFLDGEHAPLDSARMQHILQAVGGRCPSLIRIPSIDEVWVKQALDIGADGVIVPRIRGADEARSVVDWCRYPPEGARSVGVGRAHGYGARFGEYLARANQDSASLGIPGEVSDARVTAAIDRIGEVCRQRDVTAGIFGIDAAAARPWIAKGFTLIAVGIDTLFLGGAAEAALRAARE
jgi:2-keto-3-deoxy-L-rhamnonate aldolase RhmA